MGFTRITQKPGDLFFVPACWAHEVVNLTSAISVNHNWANAASLRFWWGSSSGVFREGEGGLLRTEFWSLVRETLEYRDGFEGKRGSESDLSRFYFETLDEADRSFLLPLLRSMAQIDFALLRKLLCQHLKRQPRGCFPSFFAFSRSAAQ